MDQNICLKTIFSVFAGEGIKKISDISENIKQSFNNVHYTLGSISDIVDESPWDSLSTKVSDN